MRAAKRRGARIGRPEVAVDRLALVQGIREGASIAELGRRLGISRPTIRKLVSVEVEKRVSSGGECFGSDRASRDDLASRLASPAGRIERLSWKKPTGFCQTRHPGPPPKVLAMQAQWPRNLLRPLASGWRELSAVGLSACRASCQCCAHQTKDVSWP